MVWLVLFFQDEDGREPVRDWLDRLEESRPAEAGKVRHHIDLLENFGPLLGAPYSKQLKGRLRELRPGVWRVTYFADARRRMILLTSFRKKGMKTDPREIKRAERFMKQWQAQVGKGQS